MRRPLLLVVLSIGASAAWASPTVVSDPTTRTDVTHCAWYIDAAARELLPAPKDAAGQPYCSRDVGTVAVGSHTLMAAFVIQDALWGEQEGPKSVPLAFARPGLPAKPSILRLAP
jgi:hypothetical protein